jgi:hypothetical protein
MRCSRAWNSGRGRQVADTTETLGANQTPTGGGNLEQGQLETAVNPFYSDTTMQKNPSQLRVLASEWLGVSADAPVRVARFRHSRALGGRRFLELKASNEGGVSVCIVFRRDDGTWSIEPQQTKGVVVVEKIAPKPIKRRGVTIQRTEDTTREFNAEIIKNQSIRLFGWTRGTTFGYDVDRTGRNPVTRNFARTFRVGDEAEYDSYNLSYIGTIVAIGEKTVSIADGSKTTRLDLYTFALRNWDFDAERARKRNSEWMD